MNTTGQGIHDIVPAAGESASESARSLEGPRLEESRAALEEGGQPDKQEFLTRHAEIAEALAGCMPTLVQGFPHPLSRRLPAPHRVFFLPFAAWIFTLIRGSVRPLTWGKR